MKRAFVVLSLVAILVLASLSDRPDSASALNRCSTGKASAVRIVGLHQRIRAGRDDIFGLARNGRTQATFKGAIVVHGYRDGQRFFSVRTRRPSRGMFDLWFALRTHHFRLVAAYNELRPSGVVCRRKVQRRTWIKPRVLAGNGCGRGLHEEPNLIIFACADVGYYVSDIHWTSWRGRHAYGSGTATAKTCIPFCAAGGTDSFPVSLKAGRLKRCAEPRNGFYHYARVRAVGHNPHGADTVHGRFNCAFH
jgi:hypothetical protein